MKPEGFLIKENGKLYLKVDKMKYPLADGLKVSADFINCPSEDYDIVGEDRSRFVKRLVLIDDDGEKHPFFVKSEEPKKQPYPSRGGNNPETNNRNGYGSGASRGRLSPEQQRERDKAKNAPQRAKDNEERIKNPAFAPYNFVPLNAQIVRNQATHALRYSGYLDVTLTAQTPFFIGNEQLPQERGKPLADRSFFRMLGQPFVPGSSLRGLTRTLVEILSFSKLEEGMYSQKHLSFRSMAEMGDRLKAAYEQLVPRNRPWEEFTAGFLFYDKDKREYYVLKAETVDRFPDLTGPKPPIWEGAICKVFSGRMPGRGPDNIGGKKRQWLLRGIRRGDRIDVPSDVAQAYRDDATRNREYNVLEKAKTAKGDSALLGYPVFYNTAPDGKMKSIGHTGYHRIPYSLSIGDHIAQQSLAPGEVDFATAIFGTTERAGCVWFEDSQVNIASLQTMPSTHAKALLTPKPTTFQHYLEQPTGFPTKMEDLRHWGDDNALIRGYKQYWHRSTPSRPEQPNSWTILRDPNAQARGTDQAAIKPVVPNTQFNGRIRFDALTDAELGGLLYALSLPEGCCHKLGLGKPIGLGSVQIGIVLNLIDRNQRYAQLWEEDVNSWHTGITTAAAQAPFKLAFAQAVGDQIGAQVTIPEDLWHHPRLQELKTMLTFDVAQSQQATWLEATRYMINGAGQVGVDAKDKEYRLRPILPKPTEVVERFKKKPKP